MRIVFIGTVQFSLEALQKLVAINVDVVGVCTKETSVFNSDFADLIPLCKKNVIPYLYVNDINSKESIEWISSLHPDIIFCFGWSSLIKKELLNLSPIGIIGFHPAFLPQNRGRHPIIWALALGLHKTASTFFFMDEGADSGDILSQEEICIDYEDDAKILYNKIVQTALLQIEYFVPLLQKNIYVKVPQNDVLANVWRKRGRRDGQIDFRMTSNAIYNLVRALAKPYIGAHIEYKGHDIVVWKAQEVSCTVDNIESGKVLEVLNGVILVKTYDGAIKILEHEFQELPTTGEYL